MKSSKKSIGELIAKVIFLVCAIVAIVAPSAKEPVSPINTFAGLELNARNPSKHPTSTKQKTAISPVPVIALEFALIKANVKNAISERPPARPSSPSVIFTAFELATNINNKNIP